MDAGATTPEFSSLLYTEPRLYDIVFPDAEDGLGQMVREALARYLDAEPRSTLDVGCGTARYLASIARTIPDCWGVDLLESNVAYARSTRPGVTLRVGDMRSVRLGRTFDVVTSFGNALSYALTDQDLARAMATLAAHTAPGGLVIVDALNARCYLDGGGFQERIETRVDEPGFTASALAIHRLDREARILSRRRTWRFADRPEVVDHARYRLLYPDELRGLLEDAGFAVRGLFDNRQFRPSELRGAPGAEPDPGGMRGRKLYAFARRR